MGFFSSLFRFFLELLNLLASIRNFSNSMFAAASVLILCFSWGKVLKWNVSQWKKNTKRKTSGEKHIHKLCFNCRMCVMTVQCYKKWDWCTRVLWFFSAISHRSENTYVGRNKLILSTLKRWDWVRCLKCKIKKLNPKYSMKEVYLRIISNTLPPPITVNKSDNQSSDEETFIHNKLLEK